MSKELTLQQASRLFGTEEAAERFFISKRWPNGVACLRCGSLNVAEVASRKPQPFRCREPECRYHFSVKTGTLMHQSRLPLTAWAWAIYLFTTNPKGVSSTRLTKYLGVHQQTAWYLAHRIRKAMTPKREKFAGPVEVDETYVGGLDRNRHFDKRLGQFEGKVAVVGILDRRTKQVRAHVVKSTGARVLHPYVISRTKKSAVVYTDESHSYMKLPREHYSVTHSRGEYARGKVSTNGIEAFWSILKRSYKGTYHTLSRKHLNRYLAEFTGRHNDRASDAVDRIGHIVKAMEGKRLRYRDLIA